MKTRWGSPFSSRPYCNILKSLEGGGPGENHALTVSTYLNHKLSYCNYKVISQEVPRFIAICQMQIMAKPGKIIDSRVPFKSRPIRIIFSILRTKNRFVKFILSFLNKNLNQILARNGGYFGEAFYRHE